MKICLQICDCCGKTIKSNDRYDWTDTIGTCVFSFEAHASIQGKIEKDLCTDCGRTLRALIFATIESLTKKEK